MTHYHFLLDLYNSMSAAAYSYDLTDLFYWCYFCVKKRWWNRFPFLYVDEVQDLSDDMIDHLQRLSVNALGRVVFFGHNAQNIARGMSLKFFNLADKLLMSDDGFSSDFIQLTKNFRSQQEIIDLGNSIFKILLLVSKGDLEIMPNEESIKSGPKPLCLEVGLEVPDLIEFNEKYLGKEYVVLVRDKDAKLNLPEELKGRFCLTIYESKGLEFDDLLLFDYFDSSESFKCWNFLNKIDIVEREVDYGEFLAIEEDLKKGRIRDDRIFLKSEMIDSNKYKVYEFVQGRTAEKDDLMFFNEINDEMKALYVAITRAKNRVVIFDTFRN